MTIRINLRALLRPLCWVQGHLWKNYAVINAWCREGRYCEWCGKQQLVTYHFEFVDGETVHIRTDWEGTTRFVWASEGEGTPNDPIRYERVLWDTTSPGDGRNVLTSENTGSSPNTESR